MVRIMNMRLITVADNLDWLGLLKGSVDVARNGFVSESIQEERWNHCKGCTFLTSNNRCRKCGCFMKLKVKFKKSKCPIGIW